MAADWDSSSSGDTVKISETRTTAADSDDAYDIDPDTENYQAGNNPEAAYRDQARPDAPNSWNGHAAEDPHDGNGHPQADHADGMVEDAELQEQNGATGSPDLWGDTDPDTANYADLDRPSTGSPDEPASLDHDQQDPDRSEGTDTGQPDQAEPTEPDTERALSPEQQRISALEAENADARQKITDLEAKNDTQATRLDRIEQLLASPERPTDGTYARERADSRSAAAVDQLPAPDAASAKRSATMAEHEGTRPGSDAKEDKHYGWRDAASSENVGIASAVVGAVDTLAQFAVHATPEGMVGLGAMALGLASVALAKAEKHAEKKRKGKGKP